MDIKGFEHYLSGTAADESPSLAEHDRRWHPDGYKPGSKCLFRENMGKGDSGDSELGIKVFSGSPNDYMRPDIGKAGSNRGIAEGYGLYSTSRREMADVFARGEGDKSGIKMFLDGEEYRVPENYDDWTPADHAMEMVRRLGGSAKNAIWYLTGEARDWLKKNADRVGMEKKGSVYEQTWFADRTPEQLKETLIDFYEPLTESQKQRIEEGLKKMTPEQREVFEQERRRIAERGGDIYDSGMDIYNAIQKALDGPEERENQGYDSDEAYIASKKRVSDFLRDLGFDGITYESSEGEEDGTETRFRNYVSFRDDNIRIDRKWRDGVEVDDEARGSAERYLASAF